MMTNVLRAILIASNLLLATLLLTGCASEPAKTKPAVLAPPAGKLSEKARQEQRQAILKVRTQTLNQLYKLKPLTRTEIEQAAGYGVFEVNGLNAVLVDAHGHRELPRASKRQLAQQLIADIAQRLESNIP